MDTTLPRGGGPDGSLPLFVAKGTYVFYCTYAMHRDPSIYGADSMVFKPERWEDPSLRPGWGYLPFNGGARTCIGRESNNPAAKTLTDKVIENLALKEMSYTVVRMLQEFKEICSEDHRPFKSSTNFVMANTYGARISLKRTHEAPR